MVEEKWEFKKGNTEVLPIVKKSEKPILKENISENMLSFLYRIFPENATLLQVSNLTLEFFCFGHIKGFIKINITSGNKGMVEKNIQGDDLDQFIKLIEETMFDENDTMLTES